MPMRTCSSISNGPGQALTVSVASSEHAHTAAGVALPWRNCDLLAPWLKMRPPGYGSPTVSGEGDYLAEPQWGCFTGASAAASRRRPVDGIGVWHLQSLSLDPLDGTVLPIQALL